MLQQYRVAVDMLYWRCATVVQYCSWNVVLQTGCVYWAGVILVLCYIVLYVYIWAGVILVQCNNGLVSDWYCVTALQTG